MDDNDPRNIIDGRTREAGRQAVSSTTGGTPRDGGHRLAKHRRIMPRPASHYTGNMDLQQTKRPSEVGGAHPRSTTRRGLDERRIMDLANGFRDRNYVMEAQLPRKGEEMISTISLIVLVWLSAAAGFGLGWCAAALMIHLRG